MWFWFLADPEASGKPPEQGPGEPNRSADEAGGSGGEGEQTRANESADEAKRKPAEAAGPGKSSEPLDEATREAAPAEAAPRHWDDGGRRINPVTLWVALPWLTSLLLHVALIVLGVVLIWSQMVVEEEAEAIVPIARLSEDPGGALDESEQLQMEAAQDVREVEPEDVAPDDAMEQLDVEADAELELVGLNAGADGGRIAPFGSTSGSGAELGAEFYGAGGNAERVAYVIDASGSMIDTMPFVLEELRRSINDLSDEQEFTVVFYQRDTIMEAPPESWKPATTDMKQQVSEWISSDSANIVPRGSTNPTPALRQVMRYDPQLVFVLSDNITGTGRYEINREDLLTMLRQSNRRQETTINTIQFMYPDPLGTLEQIAEDHGGVFRFITEADLGLR